MAKGSVIKRSGSWYAVYRDGIKQKWEKAGNNKRSAEKLLAHRMDQVHTETYQEREKILFSEFSTRWLNDYARVNVKESTFNSYAVIIRLHLNPYFGHKWLHTIVARDIQNFISEKLSSGKLSAKSVVNFVIPLKRMFKDAILWGYLRNDPSQYVSRPRVEEKEMDFLIPQEIVLFLKNVAPACYALFMTAVMTGMRRGELIAIKWGDVDFRSSQIIVRRAVYRGRFVSPKSRRSQRRIMMPLILSNELRRHKLMNGQNSLDLVFTNRDGNLIDPDNLVRREFYPALENAGLRRIRFHDLRHTYVSLLLSQGENIKFVQSQLGHASAKTTLDRYGHLMPNLEYGAAKRLENAVFGNSVRKLLENPESEGNTLKAETPEVVRLQELKFGSGDRI